MQELRGTQSQGGEAVRDAEISRLCREIDKALAGLSEAVQILGGRIASVSRPSIPTTEGINKDVECTTDHGKILRDYRNSIRNQTMYLADITSRVEL